MNRNASCAKAGTRFRRGGLRDDSGSCSAAAEHEIASPISLRAAELFVELGLDPLERTMRLERAIFAVK